MVCVHTHTHTQCNISQPLKEWNNSICSNMEGPRDYHTKWNQQEKDKYMMSLICRIYLHFVNELIYKTEKDRKQTYGCQRGGGRDKFGICN